VPVPLVYWLSRPTPGAGLVALSQTFVRRCYNGLGSSRACREPANQKTEGQSAFGAVKFSGRAKRHRPYPWLTRCSLANRRLTPTPRAGRVALRQTFVRRCQRGLGSSQGLPGIGKSEHDGGTSAFGAVKFSGAARARHRRHTPRSLANRLLSRLSRGGFAPNTCSSLPWRLRFTRACGNRQSMMAGQSGLALPSLGIVAVKVFSGLNELGRRLGRGRGELPCTPIA
jgi:hypothetical protein